jgi:alkanesulfonate monooxygenase SsuD/methylene tetrahydromethanopterin reductase-like flavin-dependent oxidoreductase (luciferase family)
MRFGIIVLGEHIAELRERARTAESLGFDVIGIGDSPNGYRELAVMMAVAAQATDHASLASMVTVPLGRHPMYVASIISALQDLSQDRVIWGIGTGGSAPGAMGLAPSTLSVLRPHVEAVRGLLAGESVTWEGSTVPALKHPRPAPMYLSAYGPAARRLAGRMFDGVILAAGPTIDLLERYVDEVRTAASSAGRNPDDVDIWVKTQAAIRPTREEALVDVKANLASNGSFGLRSEAQLATVPEELRPKVVELQRRYDPTKHVIWDGPNAALLDELGLTDYLAGRFAIVGNEEECLQQIEDIAKTGISTVVISGTGRDPEGVIERVAMLAARQ